MTRPFRNRGRVLSDTGRHALVALVLAAIFAAAALDPNRGGEGEPIPPLDASHLNQGSR